MARPFGGQFYSILTAFLLLTLFLTFASHSSVSWSSPKRAHNQMGDGTTVVIGAGSIGLSTAYQLALRQRAKGVQNKIIVLEALPAPFAATSGTCTGCLHYEYREDEGPRLTELGKYSFGIWQAMSQEDPVFKAAVGYREHCFFELDEGQGLGLNELPDWFKAEPSWDIDEEEKMTPNAVINPGSIGDWLASACALLGVEIRVSSTASSVKLSSEGTVQSVTYQQDEASKQLPCETLVIAAGPWTPTVYKQMFPKTRIQLQSDLNAGDWLLVRNPFPVIERSIAFVALDNFYGEKLEFAGRQDGTIWVTGRKDLVNVTLPPVGQYAEPDEAMIQELIGRVKQYVARVGSTEGEELSIVGKGRGIRPVANTLLPIISAVEPKDLSSDAAPSSKDASSGVFVSWGHGGYGVSLGMGTGKLLAQLIQGEEPDIDISAFDIARDRLGEL